MENINMENTKQIISKVQDGLMNMITLLENEAVEMLLKAQGLSVEDENIADILEERGFLIYINKDADDDNMVLMEELILVQEDSGVVDGKQIRLKFNVDSVDTEILDIEKIDKDSIRLDSER